MACGCSRLRLGGVTIDNKFKLHPYSWDGLFGFPGRDGSNIRVIGRVGAFRQTPKLALERLFTLGLLIRPHDASGLVTLPSGGCQHLEANEDEILGIIGTETAVQLEWDSAGGGTRYLDCEFTDAMTIQQDGRSKRLPLIGRAWYPAWRSTLLVSDTVTGTQAKTFGGKAPADDCIVEFAAAGRLTHDPTGDFVDVSGAGYPVVVDCGNRTVLQGTTPVDGRMTPKNSRWLHVLPGSISFTASAGSITLKHRDAWW